MERPDLHPCTAVFVRPLMALRPDNPSTSLGCALDDAGFPITDQTGRTTIEGIWAAGNATDPRAQVITAAGQGSAAAIAINNDLVQDDIRLAVNAAQ